MSQSNVSAEELVELQIKLTYQDKSLADLNEALIDQSRTLLEMVRRVDALEKVVRSLSATALQSMPQPPNEKPPHY
jgi:uncharacterized coiled-coil protein SlyX